MRLFASKVGADDGRRRSSIPVASEPVATQTVRIAEGYAWRMANQLVTRIDDQMAAAVDELVAAGVVATRSEAVRLGLAQLVDRHRRAQVGAAIAAGYRARPQVASEVGWADEASAAMIADEPW